MRVFVAIFPDQTFKGHLRDLLNQSQKYKSYLRFTHVDQIHLTLKFLGDNISEKTFQVYSEELEKGLADFPSFEITPAELSFGYKFQIRPKVLILNVEDNKYLDALTQIATNSAKSLNPHDIISKKELKKHIHHITIGRPKRTPSKSEGKKIKEYIEAIEPYSTPFKVDRVYLIESRLTAQGPIYKILKSYELKGE